MLKLLNFSTHVPSHSMNVIRNLAFAKMCDMIGRYGVGYKPPTYHDIREKLMKQAVDITDI